MVSKSLIADGVSKSLSLVILIVLLLAVLSPFAIITFNTFKTEAELYTRGPLSLPKSLDLTTLRETWARVDYTTKLMNSLVISTAVAFLAVGLSLLNAYALGIGQIRGRAFLLVLFILAITLPEEVLAYPLYYFFKSVGLYNTRLAVILVLTVLHASYGTYLLTSVFSVFSRELIDAAMIDGCNKLQLLFKIIVPLSKPSLSVLFVFFFIWTWNAFFLPLIFLVSNTKQTVPLAAAVFQTQHETLLTPQSASAFLGVLPCLIFFVLFQRTLTKGITVGALK
ncbi:MAG: carbohydrate ABC transporter permease [Anaerolineae bacterium]|nr:carbohydrate ABC transporter permease [Anaerolineae bacterium]MDW8100467.1 carbohydrate ABC transporter permease [Anaerolineae bacterium]